MINPTIVTQIQAATSAMQRQKAIKNQPTAAGLTEAHIAERESTTAHHRPNKRDGVPAG